MRAFLAISDDKGIATFYARSHNRIQLNIAQHLECHLAQILQHDFDVWKLKIFRQLANAVIKSFVAVFEVQLDIPPVFPRVPAN